MFPFPVQSYHKVNVGNLTNLLDLLCVISYKSQLIKSLCTL